VQFFLFFQSFIKVLTKRMTFDIKNKRKSLPMAIDLFSINYYSMGLPVTRFSNRNQEQPLGAHDFLIKSRIITGSTEWGAN
jgi:hypothetical protein